MAFSKFEMVIANQDRGLAIDSDDVVEGARLLLRAERLSGDRQQHETGDRRQETERKPLIECQEISPFTAWRGQLIARQ